MSLSVLILWLGVLFPVAVHAGHGVEDTVDNLSAERAKQLMDAGEKLVFIDLRPAKEFAQTRLPSARSIPLAEVANRFSEIPKTGRVILYCDCKPYDIADRAVFLEYRGYRNIFIMPEGYSGWVKRGYPIETSRR
ncbi:MAG: rhodanese-like domain-containing protein [Candidatus Binatia bacterium]